MPDITLSSIQPRSTYTLSELQDRVAGDIEIRGTLRITPTDIQNWANEAQDKLARLTLWCQDIVYVDSVASQREYVMPNNCLSIRAVKWLNRPLAPMTMEELDILNYYWRDSGTGQPVAYYLRGTSAFGVYYTPSSGITAAFAVDYALVPPHITAPQDQFYVPAGAEDAIITYCKLMASIKNAQGEGKNRIPIYKQLWEEDVQRLKEQVDSAQMNHVLVYGGEADYQGLRLPGLYFNPYTQLGPGS